MNRRVGWDEGLVSMHMVGVSIAGWESESIDFVFTFHLSTRRKIPAKCN
jgi:hypothetical protein